MVNSRSFACAGLDSLVKQLIKDALPDVINCNEGAERMFRTDIERRIRLKKESLPWVFQSKKLTSIF